MFATIVNEETHEVQLVVGEKMISLTGATDMEVEQAYNGSWYVKGYAPAEPEDSKKEKRRNEILTQLGLLDLKAVRPLRAISAGTATEEDTQILEDIEYQAEALRAELKTLED